jgi:hypothetical protein
MVTTRSQSQRQSQKLIQIETQERDITLHHISNPVMSVSTRSKQASTPEDDEISSIGSGSASASPRDKQSVSSSAGIVTRFKNSITNVIPEAKPFIASVYRIAGLYMFWILLHYVTAQFYVKYCANPTFYGFLSAPFLMSAPHCMAMRWVFAKAGTLIEGMWVLIGTWLCAKLLTKPMSVEKLHKE